MTEIISALQEEIEAAERKRESASVCWVSRHAREQIEFGYTRYIEGLQTALALLTREPTRELPY